MERLKRAAAWFCLSFNYSVRSDSVGSRFQILRSEQRTRGFEIESIEFDPEECVGRIGRTLLVSPDSHHINVPCPDFDLIAQILDGKEGGYT